MDSGIDSAVFPPQVILLGAGKTRSVPVLWAEGYLVVHQRFSSIPAWAADDHKWWVVCHCCGARMMAAEFPSLIQAICAAQYFMEQVEARIPGHRTETLKIDRFTGQRKVSVDYLEFQDHLEKMQLIATEARNLYAIEPRKIS